MVDLLEIKRSGGDLAVTPGRIRKLSWTVRRTSGLEEESTANTDIKLDSIFDGIAEDCLM